MESVRKDVKEERSSEASEAGREVASVASSGAAAILFGGDHMYDCAFGVAAPGGRDRGCACRG